MLYNNSYDLKVESLYTARKAVSLQWRYEEYKKLLSHVLVLFFLAPMLMIMGFKLKNRRKSLVKKMRRGVKEVHNLSDYLEVRKGLDELKPLLNNLNKVKSYRLDSNVVFLRYPLAQMQKLSSTLFQYNSWVEQKLNKYNSEQFKVDRALFKYTSEKELWENRNKAYSYWM